MSILRALLFLLFAAQAASAATFKNDATPVTVTNATAGHSIGVAIIRASDGTRYSSGSYTPVGGFINGVEKTISSTQLGFDFYIVVFSAPSALWGNLNQGGKMHRWISAYEVGGDEPQTSTNGPYGPDGPTDDEGNPIDPEEGAPPNNSYKASIELSVPADSITNKSFLVTGKEGDNTIIFEHVFTLIPGATEMVNVTNPRPFTLSAQEVLAKVSSPDPEITGNESDPDNPSDWKPIGQPQTVNSTGQQAPPPTSGGPEVTNEKTAQNGSNAKPAAQNETRPGDPEGNADARSQELRNEIQRLTDQVKTSGDAAKAGIDETNKQLQKLNGGSGGASGTGANFGAPSESALGFAGSIGAKASGLGSALGNLLGAAGLGASAPGSNALTWQVPVMGDTVTVSVEEHSSVFLAVRSAILWVASAFFIWRVFSIMRGAFADEGK